MLQRALVAGVSAAIFFSTPAIALTAKEKMETCRFGADDQKLTGAKRNDFIKKCMADETSAPAKQTKQK